MGMTGTPSGTTDADAVTSRLVGLARDEWRRLVAGTFFLAIGSGAGLLYPQGIRIIIDDALTSGDASIVDTAAIALFFIFIIQAVAVAFRSVLFTVAGERIVARLRSRLYQSIMNQEIAFFDTSRTGELLNRLSADTQVLQNTVSVNVSMALRGVAASVGSIGFLFWTSVELTGLMLLVVPPVAIGAVFFGRRVRRISREVQDSLAGASEVAEETIAGIRTVRAFTAEAAEGARYDTSVEQSFELARRRAHIVGRFMGGTSFAGYVAAALVLWWGGHLVIDGAMSVGELTSFLVYTLITAFSIGSLSSLWTDLMKATGSAERIYEIIDRVPTMPVRGGERPQALEGALSLRGVSFHYPTRPDVTVLRDVNLDVAAGEIVALVGPSGSGKTTIASLVTRLYDPPTGQVTLDGHDLVDLDPEWARDRIGIVAQEPILFSASIAQNIRYARPDATTEEVEAAARAANAHDFIVGFPEGYDTHVGERGVQLSGGQKQRVAIARAVLKDPRVLLLDEATSALDAQSEHLVKEALDRLMNGRTTLIIAHRLSTVRDADRVVVLAEGQIVQSGAHAELLEEENGLYHQLLARQLAEPAMPGAPTSST
ncbi:MAG: ATP-binding cassette domain-containing protein [Deltaproteobacteria bacterium]|nr:ATP-binding cassette domain-containing protein [Deltaproteobacteria bacterium]